FVKAFGRRRVAGDTFVAGWVTVPRGSRIGLGSEAQAAAMATLEGPARPDVAGALPFRLSGAGADRPTTLHVQTPDGQQFHIALASLHQGNFAALPGRANSHIGIDQLRGGTTAGLRAS